MYDDDEQKPMEQPAWLDPCWMGVDGVLLSEPAMNEKTSWLALLCREKALPVFGEKSAEAEKETMRDDAVLSARLAFQRRYPSRRYWTDDLLNAPPPNLGRVISKRVKPENVADRWATGIHQNLVFIGGGRKGPHVENSKKRPHFWGQGPKAKKQGQPKKRRRKR